MNIVENFFSEVIKVITNDLDKILSIRTNKTAKDDGSFVTSGDIYVQEVICELFNKHFSNSFLFSEEIKSNYDKSIEFEYLGMLDPIDGTENFLSGLPEWGIGISIYSNNSHIGSMILIPEMDLKIKTGDSINFYNSRISGLSSTIRNDSKLHLSAQKEYRIMGCSMYNIFNTIRGSFNSFENINGVHAWDLLPGVNLALEHGLHVEINGKKYEGEFLFPDKKYTVKINRQDRNSR